jgi:hypothetical protein
MTFSEYTLENQPMSVRQDDPSIGHQALCKASQRALRRLSCPFPDYQKRPSAMKIGGCLRSLASRNCRTLIKFASETTSSLTASRPIMPVSSETICSTLSSSPVATIEASTDLALDDCDLSSGCDLGTFETARCATRLISSIAAF